MGRALRLGGKRDKTAYIIVPILMEPGQDPVEALKSSAYAPVWQVVNAPAAHDETLVGLGQVGIGSGMLR
ncbi:hypothetical protein [Streptomyces sp. IB2014 016-6]|uniref:hypothetical protein n=1 Tax=Streptomyces sp. IB2014 016-6 TaxID=2517818 RepID=UPI001F4FE0A2|nr:hypothetical protein [Streptomyces sp. IB2014 016-6]